MPVAFYGVGTQGVESLAVVKPDASLGISPLDMHAPPLGIAVDSFRVYWVVGNHYYQGVSTPLRLMARKEGTHCG